MPPPPWAYQVENFDPPPHDELICSICQCVFCEPVECACRHVFCSSCIGKWVALHRNCPICRKRTSETMLRPVNRIIKNLIMGLTLRCKNANFGCDAQITLDLCEAHMKVCIYELEDCTNGCGKLIFRKDIVKHKQEECPFRRIQCNECGLNIEGSPADHNCIASLKQAIREKEKENNELKEEVKSLRNMLDEKSKTSNIYNASFDFDSILTSCTSDSDSVSSLDHQEMPSISLTSSSSSSSSGSDHDLAGPIVTFPEPIVLSPHHPHSSSSHNSSNGGDTPPLPLESMLMDFIEIESTPGSSGQTGHSASSGDDSTNMRRPMKRRLRIESSVSSSSNENFIEQNTGARKAQKSSPNMSSLVLTYSSPLSEERNNQTVEIDTPSDSSARCRPVRHKNVAWKQGDVGSPHSVNDTSPQPSTSRSSCPPNNENSVVSSTSAAEDQDNRSVVQIFKRTLSLLRQHNIDSDPEWVPDSEAGSDSEYTPSADLHNTSSEPECTPGQAHSSSDEESRPASRTDTESSYEVQVPTPTYDLLQKYCELDDSDDPDWAP